MGIAAIRTEGQAAGPGGIVQLHADGDFIRDLRRGGLVNAQGATAESLPLSMRDDPPGTLGPGGLGGLPELGIEFANGQPVSNLHGRGIGENGLECGDGDGVAEIIRDRRFHIHDPPQTALGIDEWPAGISFFHGHGQLDQLLAFDIAHLRYDTADDAVTQAEGIAHGDDGGALGHFIARSHGERRDIEDIDPKDDEVILARPAHDLCDFGPPTILQFHRDGPGLAHDVEVRDDQSVLGNDKAGSQPLGITLAPGIDDGQHGGPDFIRDLVHGQGFRAFCDDAARNAEAETAEGENRISHIRRD